MEFIEKVYTYINNLEERRFYQYIAAFLGCITLITAILVFSYYRNVWSLKSEVIHINELREEVRSILDRGQIVKKEQREIDSLIAKEENFKIAGYFEGLLSNQGLSNKRASVEVSSPGREGKYKESILVARFTSMTMKELTELLQELEKNRRVFIKELDITLSQKTPNTIDVTLTIATLEPKPKAGISIAE